MREVNKSSSFYGEEYYQKARRKSYIKKQVYRESNNHKAFYDQEPQLEILRYYKNLEEKCQMQQYFEFLYKVFKEFEHVVYVRTNEEYHKAVENFNQKMKIQMNLFHQNMLCKQYITREEYMNLNLHSAQDCKNFWIEQDKIKWESKENSDDQRRLLTCNLCPIYVEEFEFNFDRIQKILISSHDYWDRLNGRQKMKKYKNHVKQTLKVLHIQLGQKCEYASITRKEYKMLKPNSRKKKQE